jgi:antitoxin (DNA-binding transcriptional repressor) of toxin-antitoxin stability system
VEQGEEFVIDRAGKPVAVLSRFDPPPRRRREPGRWKDHRVLLEGWEADLPLDVWDVHRESEPA